MEITKKVLVIGYAKSGRAAEQYLVNHGHEVVLWTDTASPMPEISDVDFAVISPGVPLPQIPIPIYAEFELPFLLGEIKPQKIIAVTGTNGKTTIVNQINDMLKNANKKTVLCGNVGTPITAVAGECKKANVVMEVSSFMLETPAIRTIHKLFRPDIAVITNITEDHLERHGNMAEYIKCKREIFANQKSGDKLILNWDDINCRKIGQDVPARKKVIWYSTTARVKGVYLDNGFVCFNGKKLFNIEETRENTPHGISNILATTSVGVALHIKKDAIISACTHKERTHKIEKVAEINGTAIYNDSKATNIAATLSACKCFLLPINLILCGKTKGQNYDLLFDDLPANVSNIIVFGECESSVLLAAEKNDYKFITVVTDINSAVTAGMQMGDRPKVLLFSPAGSSFDMYKSYKDRGDVFRATVHALTDADNVGTKA